ncbi:hypothetical protein CYMTET_23990 [Cymbomonas tetramitiformis]|uniref:Negatively light-regulated protein n=1 Tax=Cymbomonas tetramitiformis TaxID=36881 RepID=A0AAE0FWR3_9CHLO|nr:hypothetical protein CYMTET_23990 [Cymbomonas tetramitiformis]
MADQEPPPAKAPGGMPYGINPKKKLIQKDVKYFDSADWALQKEKGGARPPMTPQEQLRPKLQPAEPRERRTSKSGLAPEEQE